MGWVARSRLASAVCNAGAFGIIETSSGEIDAVCAEISKMGQLTSAPFGVNLPLSVVGRREVIDLIIAQGVRFVTTSAGSPEAFTGHLKDAGLTVYHVVPSLEAARRAEDAGVDGLVVEGGEGGGAKAVSPVSTMVLLPLVRDRVSLPLIAAGGIMDGRSMAAAFALGAEGVQMGTRMLASRESPVHDNWKRAILAAAETDTLVLNGRRSPSLRVLRTAHTLELLESDHNLMEDFKDRRALMAQYFDGDMNVSIPFSGQVVGRVESIEGVADIIADTVRDFTATVDRMANRPEPGQA
jgi:enoyl-[acyl-carrier protein] reductase II